MKMPKPSEADKERFQELVPDDPRVAVRPMFGNVAAFGNDNMFMGLFGSQVGLKLPPEAAEQLSAIEGSGPFGPEERPMGGYVSLPPDLAGDPAAAQPWVDRALDHVGALPPKQRKPKK